MINDSDYVNFYYVYDIYCKLGFIFEFFMIVNMVRFWMGDFYEERIWEIMKLKEFFCGELSGLMVYKVEDIYFIFFNGLYGSVYGYVFIGGFIL